jgi:hypothetical protein
MSNPTNPTQPGWSQPPTQLPPQPPKRRQRGKIIALALLTVVVLVAIVGALASNTPKATVTATSTPATSPADTTPTEGSAASDTSAAPAEVATGKVGDTVTTQASDTGEKQAEITIAKVKFSGGTEFDKPSRGLYMGAYVTVRALADNVSTPWGDIYATVNGHHHDGDACCPEFGPSLDYVNLNKGEHAEGWLAFDVPSRHGQLVLRNASDNSKIAVWTF